MWNRKKRGIPKLSSARSEHTEIQVNFLFFEVIIFPHEYNFLNTSARLLVAVLPRLHDYGKVFISLGKKGFHDLHWEIKASHKSEPCINPDETQRTGLTSVLFPVGSFAVERVP